MDLMDEEAQVPTPRHEKQKITPRRTGTWHLGKKEVTERCPLLADEEEASRPTPRLPRGLQTFLRLPL